jgi:hypothetical protein
MTREATAAECRWSRHLDCPETVNGYDDCECPCHALPDEPPDGDTLPDAVARVIAYLTAFGSGTINVIVIGGTAMPLYAEDIERITTALTWERLSHHDRKELCR